MVKQLHPNARDAAQRRVNRVTVGVIAASIAATLGIGAGIAVATPPPKANNKTDYSQKSKNNPPGSPTPAAPAQPQTQPGQQQQPAQPQQQAQPQPAPQQQAPVNDKPESSTGDEETTTGGS